MKEELCAALAEVQVELPKAIEEPAELRLGSKLELLCAQVPGDAGPVDLAQALRAVELRERLRFATETCCSPRFLGGFGQVLRLLVLSYDAEASALSPQFRHLARQEELGLAPLLRKAAQMRQRLAPEAAASCGARGARRWRGPLGWPWRSAKSFSWRPCSWRLGGKGAMTCRLAYRVFYRVPSLEMIKH